MRSSNPVFSTLTQDATRGSASYQGQMGATQMGAAQQQAYTTSFGQYGAAQGYDEPRLGGAAESTRSLTVDDVITKTAITLGVIVLTAVVNFGITLTNPSIGLVLTGVGAIGGLIAVLVSSFGRKFGSAAVTLTYAAFEGLFVGGISFVFAGFKIGDANGFSIIFQAVVATLGVFAGMLYAYKSGAIKVTNKMRRFITGGIVGVLVLAIGNMLAGMFLGVNPLTDGGAIAIVFSLVCIGLAAMSFLVDFDQADRLVRAGAPANYAWGIALGLAVTLVWLYTEILRLLSYFRD